MRPCLQKLEPGFWIYDFASLLALIDQKLVPKLQSPKATFLLIKVDKMLDKVSL